MPAHTDLHWMRRALRLAAKGFTPPNPMVGCVIVADDRLVGEGYHPIAGEPHAEVFALRMAGHAARGATAYVTLEPCCHYGKTPPCSDALIAAGLKRVVVATEDVDARVAGKGVAQLKQAGIEVEVGLLAEQSRELNDAFFHYHRAGTPFVTLKSAVTLDGKIAVRSGESKWITGPRARTQVHRLRAQSGAVMVGIGTIMADDAELTARQGVQPLRQPLRIIVDSQLRTPLTSRAVIVTSDKQPLLIAATEEAPIERETAFHSVGVDVLRTPPTPNGRVDLVQLMSQLGRRGIISVLVEGGGELNAAMLEAGVAHKVLFFIAPKIFGGRDAPTAIEGYGVDLPSSAIPLTKMNVRQFGQDIAIEANILRP